MEEIKNDKNGKTFKYVDAGERNQHIKWMCTTEGYTCTHAWGNDTVFATFKKE